MKPVNLRVRLLFLFLLLISSCGSQRPSNEGELLLDNPSESAKPKKEVSSDDEPFRNSKGWHIPLPEHTKIGPKNSTDMLRKDGLSRKVVFTTLLHDGSYQFKIGFDSDEEFSSVPKGEMKLLQLREVSSAGKVFGYVILAEHLKSGAISEKNGTRPHAFFYEIVDSDGDGIFESLYLSLTGIPVPNWV